MAKPSKKPPKKKTAQHRPAQGKSKLAAAVSADPVSLPSGTRTETERQWDVFDGKRREFRPDESRIMTTIGNIHELQRQALWFAEHTPVPFRAGHSEVALLARLTIRYLCDQARLGSVDAIRDAGELTVDLAGAA